jgi:protein Tex
LPSHRVLALFRGEKEEVLTLELMPDPAAPDRGEPSAFERQIASRFKIVDHGRPGDRRTRRNRPSRIGETRRR